MSLLFVGTYTESNAPAIIEGQELGKGIYIYQYDEELGVVKDKVLCTEMTNPSWVSVYDGRVFAVSESEDAAILQEYEMIQKNKETALNLINKLVMKGSASCHIEIDEKRKRLFLSDYGSGDLKVIDISKKGDPRVMQELHFIGRSIRADRQEASHLHSSNLYHEQLFAADLGKDRIYVFDTSGEYLKKKEELVSTAGAGPRHMAVLENRFNDQMLYVVNELNLSLSVYRNGKEIQTLSLLEKEDLKDKALAADICKSEDGCLYVSIRGSGEIRTFQVKDTGELEQLQVLELSEKGLRSICLDNSQKHLLVADQTSGMIQSFLRKEDGTLRKGIPLVHVPAAVKVLIAR